MRTLIFTLMLMAVNCLGAPQPGVWLNSWDTNRGVLPVFGLNNLSISNRIAGPGGGTNWDFFGIGASTVARLLDITNAGTGLFVLKNNGFATGLLTVDNQTNTGTLDVAGAVTSYGELDALNGYGLAGGGSVTGAGMKIDYATASKLAAYDANKILTNSIYSDADIAALIPGSLTAGYSNRISVPIVSQYSGDATNVRIPITLTSSDINFGIVQADGDDIIPIGVDGKTRLAFYLKSITATNCQIVAVIPFLPHDTTQTIYVDYGNASATITGSLNAALTNTISVTNWTVLRCLFNEGSGTNIVDSGGAFTNGSLGVVNGVWSATGSPGPNGTNTGFNGPVLTLPASSGYALATNANALSHFGIPAWTMRMWVQFTNIDNNFDFLMQKPVNGLTTWYGILARNKNFKLQGYTSSDGNTSFAGTTVITNGIWYHVVATVGPTGHRLYVNGKLDMFTNAPYAGIDSTLANGKPFIINGDNRNGTPAANTTGIKVGPVQMDYHEWTFDEVSYDFNFWGTPVPVTEQRKWVHGGQLPAALVLPTNICNEASQILSSYDHQWKVLYSDVLEQKVYLAEGQMNGPYVAVGSVLGGGVGGESKAVGHSFSLDDGNGRIYCYWMDTTNYNVKWSSSIDGGHTFGNTSGTITISNQFINARTTSVGSQGNVSMTRLTEGPFAGQFVLVTDMKNPVGTLFWDWVFIGTNYFGTFAVQNNGYPITNASFYVTGNLSDPSSVYWFDGRYQLLMQDGYSSAPTWITRISTTDFSTWRAEGGGLELNDQTLAFDQVGDVRYLNYAGSCSMLYTLVNNQYGNSGYPQIGRPLPGFCGIATYNGTREQLWRNGAVSVRGNIVSGVNPPLSLGALNNAFVSSASSNTFSGSIGIGTLSPAAKLDVQGNVTVTGGETNKGTTTFPTNNAAHTTIAPTGLHTVALGKGWTNDLGARADLILSVKLVDAVTGDPAIAFTNTVTGEAWTNNIIFGAVASVQYTITIPDLSPSDYGSFTDLSGAGASVTILNSWWKLK